MAKYRLALGGGVICGNAHIPPVEDNMDFREYLAWIAEGNTPDPYVDPETLLTPKQKAEKKLAQTDQGLMRVFEDYILLQVSNGALSLDEFPEKAKNKLLERIELRKVT
jgi:hypothetical protein